MKVNPLVQPMGPLWIAVQRFAVLGFLFLPVVVGCGGDGLDRVPMEGTVNLDGQPLERGSIRLSPKGEFKGADVATKIVNGRFQFDTQNGPVVGLHRVEILSEQKFPDPSELDTEQGPKPVSADMIQPQRVHASFNVNSKLEADTSLKKSFEFNVTSSGK